LTEHIQKGSLPASRGAENSDHFARFDVAGGVEENLFFSWNGVVDVLPGQGDAQVFGERVTRVFEFYLID